MNETPRYIHQVRCFVLSSFRCKPCDLRLPQSLTHIVRSLCRDEHLFISNMLCHDVDIWNLRHRTKFPQKLCVLSVYSIFYRLCIYHASVCILMSKFMEYTQHKLFTLSNVFGTIYSINWPIEEAHRYT